MNFLETVWTQTGRNPKNEVKPRQERIVQRKQHFHLAASCFLVTLIILIIYLLYLVKAMTNLESVLKSRDITLPTKVHLVKAMVFPVVMYGCKSWTIKKAERQSIDAFKLWCWRRLLPVPWTARR